MWLMKRVTVDGWDLDRAMQEATTMGLTNEALKQFFSEQARTRKR